MEGKVNQRAECCPISNALYNDIKKDAITKAGEPRRMLKQLNKHVTTTFRPGNVIVADFILLACENLPLFQKYF